MNIDKVKQTLRKVNALIENLDSQGSTSAIERDLLRRYLTDLYEEVALDSRLDAAITRAVESAPEPEPEPEAVAEVHPIQHTTVESRETVKPLDEQTTYYDAEAASTNGNTSEAPVADASINQFSDSSRYFPPDAVEGESITAAPEPAAKPVQETDVAVDEERFAAIFKSPESADLATKFASGRIETIDSAMGINQRLLIVNELFGGDMQAFNTSVQQLNECSSFSEASSLLIDGPASAYGWDTSSKEKIARDFVQIVRRKYH